MSDATPEPPTDERPDRTLAALRVVAASVAAAALLTAVDVLGPIVEGALPIDAIPLVFGALFAAVTPATALLALANMLGAKGQRGGIPRALRRSTPMGTSRRAPLVTATVYVALLGLLAVFGVSQIPLELLQGLDWRVARSAAILVSLAIALGVYVTMARRQPRTAGPVGFLPALVTATCAYLVIFDLPLFKPYSTEAGILVLGLVATATVTVWFDRVSTARCAAIALIGCVVAAAGLQTFSPVSPATVHALDRAGLALGSVSLLRSWTDLDGDGYSSLLGGGDCEPLDPAVGPNEVEVVGNGIDENCRGGDAEASRALQTPKAVSEAQARPNILFLSVDTLRFDAVGRSVDGKPVTPHVDAFLSRSVVFERAYAPSTHTNESIPATMTGRYPSDWHHGAVFFGMPETIFEHLLNDGYRTSAVTALTHVRERVFLGFEDTDNRLGANADFRVTSEQVTDAALERAASLESTDEPWALWVHYFDPHVQRLTSPSLSAWLGDDTMWERYHHELHRTDRAFGRLLASLRALGALSNTIVVFFSDHGEGLGDHNFETHYFRAYEEIVRVPLAFHGPYEPRSWPDPVSLVDIAPTVAALVGVPEVRTDGRSLVPVLTGGSIADKPVYVDVNFETALYRVIVRKRWKLIYDSKRGTYSLFDLQEDPRELQLANEKAPDILRTLRDELWERWDGIYNTTRLSAKAAVWEERKDAAPGAYRGPDLRREE